jgi:Spy/CpxP family protein refolding chaperone
MKKLMIVAITGLMFLGLASQRSYADPCGCGEKGMHGEPRMMHHGQDFRGGSPEARHFLWKKIMALDLNDKQKDALQAVRSRVVKDTIKKRADLELARVELRELLHKDPVKMSAVEASLKKVETVRTDLHLAHIKAREEVKAILTPEQQKKLKEDFKTGFMMHEGRYGENESKTALLKDEAQHGPEEE